MRRLSIRIPLGLQNATPVIQMGGLELGTVRTLVLRARRAALHGSRRRHGALVPRLLVGRGTRALDLCASV
eukprot:3892434-Karenia_brevis.AAC.1